MFSDYAAMADRVNIAAAGDLERFTSLRYSQTPVLQLSPTRERRKPSLTIRLSQKDFRISKSSLEMS